MYTPFFFQFPKLLNNAVVSLLAWVTGWSYLFHKENKAWNPFKQTVLLNHCMGRNLVENEDENFKTIWPLGRVCVKRKPTWPRRASLNACAGFFFLKNPSKAFFMQLSLLKIQDPAGNLSSNSTFSKCRMKP